MTKDKFIQLLESNLLDEGEVNTLDAVGTDIIVELQDGSRFQIIVEKL